MDTKQKELLKALSSINRIGFHTNGIEKSFNELDFSDTLIAHLDLGIEGETSYRIQIVGKVASTGTCKSGVGSLSLSVDSLEIDNIDLRDE